MPEIGETWSFLDAGTSHRVEAVLIATGPTTVRLVDHFGRRISVPTSSLSNNWQLVSPVPSNAVRCHKCTQLAYFRFIDWDLAHMWTCEEHLPHGSRAYFPGETPSAESPGLGMACPQCGSTQIKIERTRLALPDNRSTVRCVCDQCQAAWSPLISMGMSDDGARLAADLHRLIESGPSVVEIRIGFTTYRNLCRSLNMGDVAQLMGVPVVRDSTLGDLLTNVFSKRGGLEASVDNLVQALEAQRPPQFCDSFKPLEVTPGSIWRRRTDDGQGSLPCSVISAVVGEVVYQIANINRVVTQNLREFLRYWTPGDHEAHPRETSIWVHRLSMQCIQVLVATTTQAANQQVRYVTSSGQHETTPLRTFQRLYRELPSPPEDHVWHREGNLFEVERRGDSVHLQPLSALGAANVVKTSSLYLDCQPLVFTESVAHIRCGTRWVNKSGPPTSVLVLDIGVVCQTPLVYVRFRRTDGTHGIDDVNVFCGAYEYHPPPAPCRKGETWFSLKDSTRQCMILEADEGHLSQATVEWRGGEVEVMPHERLITEHRKLDVRSYWQMLDNEDED